MTPEEMYVRLSDLKDEIRALEQRAKAAEEDRLERLNEGLDTVELDYSKLHLSLEVYKGVADEKYLPHLVVKKHHVPAYNYLLSWHQAFHLRNNLNKAMKNYEKEFGKFVREDDSTSNSK